MRELPTQQQQVYQALREQLISGRFSPGASVSLRGLSKSMGVGLMPVREAITRLGGERALEVRRNGRVGIPELTRGRFEELMQARLQLERDPYPLPTMRLSPTVDTIFGFRYEDFELLDYQSHPRITAPIAV